MGYALTCWRWNGFQNLQELRSKCRRDVMRQPLEMILAVLREMHERQVAMLKHAGPSGKSETGS